MVLWSPAGRSFRPLPSSAGRDNLRADPPRQPAWTRRKIEPQRVLIKNKRQVLARIRRADGEPAGQVGPVVAAGQRHTGAAAAAGRKTGDPVACWLSEFNRQGGVTTRSARRCLRSATLGNGRALGAGTGQGRAPTSSRSSPRETPLINTRSSRECASQPYAATSSFNSSAPNAAARSWRNCCVYSL